MEPQESYPEDSLKPIDAGTLWQLLHELRNPLTVMTARTQMLTRAITQDRLQTGEDLLPSLMVMEEAARKFEAVLKAFQASAGAPRTTTGEDGPEPRRARACLILTGNHPWRGERGYRYSITAGISWITKSNITTAKPNQVSSAPCFQIFLMGATRTGGRHPPRPFSCSTVITQVTGSRSPFSCIRPTR